jgi:hypothetical protein
MGKSVINREQCNNLEELLVRALVAVAAITMSSVTAMVGSYSICLCAVLA